VSIQAYIYNLPVLDVYYTRMTTCVLRFIFISITYHYHNDRITWKYFSFFIFVDIICIEHNYKQILVVIDSLKTHYYNSFSQSNNKTVNCKIDYTCNLWIILNNKLWFLTSRLKIANGSNYHSAPVLWNNLPCHLRRVAHRVTPSILNSPVSDP